MGLVIWGLALRNQFAIDYRFVDMTSKPDRVPASVRVLQPPKRGLFLQHSAKRLFGQKGAPYQRRLARIAACRQVRTSDPQNQRLGQRLVVRTPRPRFWTQASRIIQQIQKQEDTGDLPLGRGAEVLLNFQPLVNRLPQIALQDRFNTDLQEAGCGLRYRFGRLRACRHLELPHGFRRSGTRRGHFTSLWRITQAQARNRNLGRNPLPLNVIGNKFAVMKKCRGVITIHSLDYPSESAPMIEAGQESLEAIMCQGLGFRKSGGLKWDAIARH